MFHLRLYLHDMGVNFRIWIKIIFSLTMRTAMTAYVSPMSQHNTLSCNSEPTSICYIVVSLDSGGRRAISSEITLKKKKERKETTTNSFLG